MIRWRALIRWEHWGESKLPFAIWGAAAGFGAAGCRDWLGLVIVTSYSFFFLAFGYLFNDFCDLDHDARAGKKKLIHGVMAWQRPLPFVMALACTCAITATAQGATAVWMAGGLVLAAMYSGIGVRLKGRDRTGVMAAAFAQWSIPILVAAQRFGAWKDLGWLALAGFLAGCRWMLIHQNIDLEADMLSGQSTYGTRVGKAGIRQEICRLQRAEQTVIWCGILFQAVEGQGLLAISLAVACLLSLGSKALSVDVWDRDFSHVTLASFYLILGPLATYPFIVSLTVPLIVLHLLLTRKMLWGEIQRCFLSQ